MRDIKDYSDKYEDEPFEATMVKIRKKMVIEQCNKYNHSHILEIGCGMEPFFMDFSDYTNMVIVEPSEKFTQNAANLAEDKGLSVKIITGTLEDRIDEIISLDIHFDFIILSSVLHELDDPQAMLKSIWKICDANTIVHINVPNAKSVHRLIAVEEGMISDVHEQSNEMKRMQRRRTYDIYSLMDETTQAGFSVNDKGSYFIKPFTHLQMQNCLDAGIIDEKVLEGLEKIIKYMPEYGAGIFVNLKRCDNE